ncbi:MAG: orc1/cdc6 family replication initiation protein [Nanoarchaeota archaeon]
MTQSDLEGFFKSFIEKDTFFVNKKALQSSYMPESIIHREKEVKQLASILAPCLRKDKPSNIFIYGKPGTGKTLTVRYVSQNITNVSRENNLPLTILYLNCKLKKIADTEYRVIAQLARELGKSIPSTGLPTEEVYKIFVDAIDFKDGVILFILDEIDQLVNRAGDEILYNLTRINEELKRTQIAIIGISNDLIFVDNLDPRVKSSLSEEEILFGPYNALQLQDILRQRCKLAFKENSLDEGLIQKCAAYAAREHGDARRCLELMRVAAEIAERKNTEKISMIHLDEAEQKIERDRVFEIVLAQPKQFQAVLYAILNLARGDNYIFTGDVYNLYKGLCAKTGLRPLTQRRLTDIIAELDMFGIINSKVISKGRYGRTKQISIAIPEAIKDKIKKSLEDALDI